MVTVAPVPPLFGLMLVIAGSGIRKLNPMLAVAPSPVLMLVTDTEVAEIRPFFGQVVGSGAGLVRMTIWLPLTESTCWATETFGLVKPNDTATGPSKPEPWMVTRVP